MSECRKSGLYHCHSKSYFDIRKIIPDYINAHQLDNFSTFFMHGSPLKASCRVSLPTVLIGVIVSNTLQLHECYTAKLFWSMHGAAVSIIENTNLTARMALLGNQLGSLQNLQQD